MHIVNYVILLSLFASYSTMAQDAATTAATTMTSLASVKDLARKEGWELTTEQTLFASDALMGYYSRQMKPRHKQVNLVWLSVEKHLREEMTPVLRLVGKLIDSTHGIEHLRLHDYLILEPQLLTQKLREQRKHLLVMDDIAELHEIDMTAKQTPEISARLNRANEYDDWLMMEAPEGLTIFVIDEDGFVLANMDPSFVSLIDFIGDKGEVMTLSCGDVLRN
jgi:hypothetical protein